MTQIQQQQLAAWMQNVANWQTLTDAQVAALYVPVMTPVPYTTFQPAVMQLACWGTVRNAAANLGTYPAALQPVILTAVDLFTAYKAPNVDLSLPAFQSALSALEQAGLVSSSDAAAIVALGQAWPVAGVTSVAAADVTTARQVLAGQAVEMTGRQKLAAGYNNAVALWDAYDVALKANPATAIAPTNAQINAAVAQQVGS